MSFIVENIRLKELVTIANANQPFFNHWLDHLRDEGYPTLYDFVREEDDAKATSVIKRFLEKPARAGASFLDGIGSPYPDEKAKWLLLGWIFRDAPEQRLKPLIPGMAGATLASKKANLLNAVRAYVRDIYTDQSFWTWSAIVEVMVDRLEGSRRAKKGSLVELMVRTALVATFSQANIHLEVANTQLRIGSETYDVVVRGARKTMLIPVKTRETMGGGHAHIFTRDIHKAVAEAVNSGYPCLPVIIAESWTGDLGGLACEDYIYIQANPNQPVEIERMLASELGKRLPLFKTL